MAYPSGEGKGGHSNAEVEKKTPYKIVGLEPDQKPSIPKSHERE
jgi:hypothetical protein